MCESERVLRSVKVSESGLPTDDETLRKRILLKRQRDERAYRVYREWLLAPDKEKAIPVLAEKWGFARQGNVRRIVETIRQNGPPRPWHEADLEAVRQVQIAHANEDLDAALGEIDFQIAKYVRDRATGVDFVPVERLTEKLDAGNEKRERRNEREKQISIDEAINRLFERKAKAYERHATALRDYDAKKEHDWKPGQGRVRMEFTGDAKFLSEWADIKRERDEMTEVCSGEEPNTV